MQSVDAGEIFFLLCRIKVGEEGDVAREKLVRVCVVECRAADVVGERGVWHVGFELVKCRRARKAGENVVVDDVVILLRYGACGELGCGLVQHGFGDVRVVFVQFVRGFVVGGRRREWEGGWDARAGADFDLEGWSNVF